MELFTKEALVADRLGVAREVLRSLRKKEGARLVEGTHWRHGENKAVEYSQAGIQEAMRILADGLPSSEAVLEVARQPERVTLYVHQATMRVSNKYIVIACRDSADVRDERAEKLRVQVRNSEKIRPGMILHPCRHVNADLYAFEGRRPQRPAPTAPPRGPVPTTSTNKETP